ncbi:hypothetical protein CDAR_369101 [Caerostris darwini]|uniref:Uncharacterized protein n=1 Tax=Caerostris darwini TaxID=1538125 RepID=A0AAV4WKW5_9ARAC|nr:hypothetical protein CDAR_369101 [Caerostris darwini]
MGCTHNSFKCSQRRKSMLLLRYISPLEPFSVVVIAKPCTKCSTFPPLQAMHRWTWPNTAGFFLTTGSSHYSCNEINFLDFTGAAHITALSAPKERNPSCCSGTLFGWNRPRYSP